MAIIARGGNFNRRTRFILTAGLSLGYGATLVPTYFNHVFTYSGDNRALAGFLDAITLIMSTGFAVTAVICMVLNLILQEEFEDDLEGDEGSSAAGVAATSSAVPHGKEEPRGESEEIHPMDGPADDGLKGEKQV
jgi:NCS2 family nucleobase:cation symporter-2